MNNADQVDNIDGKNPSTPSVIIGPQNFLISQNQIPFGEIKELHLVSSTTIASGDMFYGDGTNAINRLAIGSNGQFLGVASGALAWSSSTGYTIEAFAGSFNPADATTYYFGSLDVQTTTAAISRVIIPKAGTIKKVSVFYSNQGTLGTTETSTLSLRLNNTTDTTVDSAIANNATTYSSNNTVSVTVAAGDYVEMKWLTPTWATNPTTVKIACTIYVE